jgi:hypothetical protein
MRNDKALSQKTVTIPSSRAREIRRFVTLATTPACLFSYRLAPFSHCRKRATRHWIRHVVRKQPAAKPKRTEHGCYLDRGGFRN